MRVLVLKVPGSFVHPNSQTLIDQLLNVGLADPNIWQVAVVLGDEGGTAFMAEEIILPRE